MADGVVLADEVLMTPFPQGSRAGVVDESMMSVLHQLARLLQRPNAGIRAGSALELNTRRVTTMADKYCVI